MELSSLENHNKMHMAIYIYPISKHHIKYALLPYKDRRLVAYTRIQNGHTEYSIQEVGKRP